MLHKSYRRLFCRVLPGHLIESLSMTCVTYPIRLKLYRHAVDNLNLLDTSVCVMGTKMCLDTSALFRDLLSYSIRSVHRTNLYWRLSKPPGGSKSEWRWGTPGKPLRDPWYCSIVNTYNSFNSMGLFEVQWRLFLYHRYSWFYLKELARALYYIFHKVWNKRSQTFSIYKFCAQVCLHPC